jgi:PAS domain S-box-containing protein
MNKLKRMLPYLVLAILLILTMLISWWLEKEQKKREIIRFDTVSNQVSLMIQNRMDTYQQVLRAGVGLFDASDHVTRDQWHRFIQNQKISNTFPGIQGIGYAQVIKPEDKAEHINAVRAEGFVNYDIKPDFERNFYTSIVYLEPFDERNQRAFGYDMFTESVRHEAMTRAVETGEPALSGKVRLVQENNIDEQAGFLIYVPVYRKDAPLDSVQARWAAIQGFVYAPFRVKNLMRGVAGKRFDSIDFTIYDASNTDISESMKLFRAHPEWDDNKNTLSQQIILTIAGRAWLLSFKALDRFEQERAISIFWLTLLAGLLLNISIFALLHSFWQTKEKAQALADEMTRRLSRSEERQRFALEGVGDGLWDWQIKTGEVFFSKRWKEMLGFAEDEISGNLNEWEKRIYPDDLEKVYISINAYLAGDASLYNSEHRVLCKDGSYKWILDRGVVVERDSDGLPVRMVGSHSDISDKKQAELALLAERNFVDTVFNTIESILIVIDRHGTIVKFNCYAQDFTGYSYEAVQSPFFWKRFLKQEQRDGVEDVFKLAKQGQIKKRYQNCWLNTQGEEKLFDWFNSLISNESGEMMYLVSVGVDITLQKEAEETLKHAKEQAEAASRAKSSFVANMSHEVRTPMNAVLGLTRLVLDSELAPQQRDYLEKVQDASTALLSILNDILDYSKIEAGKLRLESIDYALDGVLRNVVGLFSAKAEEKHIEIYYRVAENVPAILSGDALRLSQVLNNLVGNAIKFTDQGKVGVYVERHSDVQGKSELIFSVQDTGIGMTSEQSNRLFHSFTQADDSTTRKYGGTGLGLTISKQLIELMGGGIGVESEFGKGSRFFFSIPFAEDSLSKEQTETRLAALGTRDELAMHPQDNAQIDLHGARILLVEDDPINCIVAQGFLKKLNVAVELAENGLQAVEAIAANTPFDLILMDLHMPVMDGLEATRRIRALPQGKSIPIIAMTAAAMKQDVDDVLAVGMNAHLAKPISSVELAHQLYAFLGTKINANADVMINEVAHNQDEMQPVKSLYSVAQVLESLESLRLLIVQNVFISYLQVSEFKQQLDGLIDSKILLALISQINKMDYDQALTSIEEIKNTLGRHHANE